MAVDEVFSPQNQELVQLENMLSSSTLHATWQQDASAHTPSNTTLAEGLVPHKILSPQEWSGSPV